MAKKARKAQATDPAEHKPTRECQCATCKRKLAGPAKLVAHAAVLKGWPQEEHATRLTLAQRHKLIEAVNESLADSGIEFIYTMRHLALKQGCDLACLTT